MYELGQFAVEGGQLSLALQQPWMQSWNGVEGVALTYDDRLVTEAVRIVSQHVAPDWIGTIEFSRLVAALLADVGSISERSRDSSRWPGRLYDWWKSYSERSSLGQRSPIVIEVTAGPEFGKEAGIKAPSEGRRYEYRIRRSRGSHLQLASAGGRIVRDGWTRQEAPPFGTIGGFLFDVRSQDLYALTAAHVCYHQDGLATPTPLPTASAFVRDAARRVLSIASSAYREKRCPFYRASDAELLQAPRCSERDAAITSGVDAALHLTNGAVPTKRVPVEIADLADVSPGFELNFVGAKSGYQRVAVASYSLWHSYRLDTGNEACIHGCLQIKLARRPYGQIDVSKGGDSGSWILARGLNQTHWVGMLTGGDGERAGIVPATRIVKHFSDELQTAFTAEI